MPEVNRSGDKHMSDIYKYTAVKNAKKEIICETKSGFVITL